MGPKSHCSLHLTAHYKHMKRAATHLLKRQSKNHAFFQNYRTFTLIQDPPRADPWARQRSENPTPGATRMCKFPGGDGQAGNVKSIQQSYMHLL